MAGVGVSTDAVATTGAVANSRVAGAALAACGDPHTPTSNPSDFVDVGGRLFFTAGDGVHGRELWTSDGTKAGTVLVKDIKPGTASGSFPYSLTAVGGRLFFTADDGMHGQELWTSDGTRAGTVLVKDITPGDGGGEYDESLLPDRRGRAVVLHRRRRHARERAVDLGRHQGGHRPGQGHQPRRRRGDYDDAPSSLTGVGGRLFFTADDGTHGTELWRSDGTRAGTVLVKDINPDTAYASTLPSSLTERGSEGCSSPPTTAPTGGSCGGRTAPGRAPSWSRTSSETSTTATPPP